MPASKFDWLNRIKSVEREFASAEFAIRSLVESARRDPDLLSKAEIRTAELEMTAGRLEGTYLVRLFAQFEVALRSYWDTIGRPTHPRSKDLIDSAGAREEIGVTLIHQVHEVRRYRNSLVHEPDEAAAPVAISEARSRLCHFIARLRLSF